MLVEIIDGTSYIYYTYDVDGTLISMNYQGVEYYYMSNLQGDIIGMIDGSGNIVVKYSYDAWGNILYQWTSITNLDDINPYRYRGYRYDEETNLYYLNARYYDPSIARFISADDVSFISDDQASSINLYAYTLNNPVMGYDPYGTFDWARILLAAGIVTSGVALLVIGCGILGFGVLYFAAVAITTVVNAASALTEKVVVMDLSITGNNPNGTNLKIGLSFIVDYDDLNMEGYFHSGVVIGNSFGPTFSVGVVTNYAGEGSYAGYFVGTGGSLNGYGAEKSIDPTGGHNAVGATSMTFSLLPFQTRNGAAVFFEYEYYIKVF